MMKRKVIFIGKTGSGKTTLCQKLNQIEIAYKKTQVVEVYDQAIDTPGEYLENRHYYSALIMTAVDADVIGLVGDPTVEENFIPPAFAGNFSKEVIGIITKLNQVKDKKLLEKVEEELKVAGVSKVFKVDTLDDMGIKPLFHYLDHVLNKQ